MRKTDKKIDNNLRLALTDVCEHALKDVDGFLWLTHLVNYSNFPQSLKVVCVFDTNAQLETYQQSDSKSKLESLIGDELHGLNIKLKKLSTHIAYDTEENCDKHNGGNWAARLS